MSDCLFHQGWWLEAVAPGQWGMAVVKRGNRVAASMPYVVKRRLGMTVLTMPPLTQFLGPWIAPSGAKYAKALGVERDLINDLIDALPTHDYFAQSFHWAVTNWLPFYWRGFDQTTRYTYIIEDLSDLDAVWSECLENIRRDVRKATRNLRVRTDLGVEVVHDLSQRALRRAGSRASGNLERLRRVDTECAARECRKMFFAEDSAGRVHAAILIVWDKDSAYYLRGGADPERRNSGANSLVFWEAIRFAATVTKRFDMEGSMIEPVERFLRGFGARQTPYSYVQRHGPAALALKAAAGAAEALLGPRNPAPWLLAKLARERGRSG